MFSAAIKSGAAAASAPVDAQFNYVTMLLHGDGTNGAQNNTFLDSSTNNFTITRNGNTTQGSFSPYGSNWSNRFNGGGSAGADGLGFANNAALNMDTGDFTLEFWINFNSLTGYQTAFAKGYTSTGDIIIQTNLNSGRFGVYFSNSAVLTETGTATVGQWIHYALVRNGSALTLYRDGQVSVTTTNSTNLSTTGAVGVGMSNASPNFYPVDAYMSNFRLVKGTAVYTSAFTPPTAPLTAISGTSLLTCQSNRFVDNSSYGFGATVRGNTSVQRFNPFGTSTAYSTATIGGSGYFDGTGDYLSVPYSASLEMGSSDFTIDGWIYPQSFAANQVIISQWNTASARSYALVVNTAGAVSFTTSADGSITTLFVESASGAAKLNQWNHVRVSKTGTAAYVGVNGVIVSGTVYSSLYSPGSNLTLIGTYIPSAPALFVSGHLSDVRVIKGTALDTGSTYTVPTAPLTAVTNTQLLTSMTNAAIYDNAMMNDLETVGNAQISTSVKKYGTGSLAFDGTGDYLSINQNSNLSFGTGDFTVEFWMNSTDTQGYVMTCGAAASTGNWGLLFYGSALYWQTAVNLTNLYSRSATSILDGNWHHVAVTRASGVQRMFFDGVLQGATVADTTNYAVTYGIGIGGPLDFYNGYIDDLRITKGYARYTTTFTPPTAAFPNIGPV